MNPSSIRMLRKERFLTSQTPFGMTNSRLFSKLLELPRDHSRNLSSNFYFLISNFCVFSEILDGLRGSPEGVSLRLKPERIFERRLAALGEQ